MDGPFNIGRLPGSDLAMTTVENPVEIMEKNGTISGTATGGAVILYQVKSIV